MKKAKSTTIEVKGMAIAIQSQRAGDFICLTDIARFKDPVRTDYLIGNWLRNRNTIEFLGIWEQLNNPDFNPIEFDGIRIQAGLNSFILTAKQWVEKTGAIGIVSQAGRYGGTYAHKDIAFEFASWVSVEFKLYLIKEFQRLKEDESQRLSLAWNLHATIEQLLVLANIEGMNAEFIHMALPQRDRLKRLNEIAIRQMQVLTAGSAARRLGEANKEKMP